MQLLVLFLSQLAILLLEDGVLDDGGPNGAVLVVAGFERAVLFLSEGPSLLLRVFS